MAVSADLLAKKPNISAKKLFCRYIRLCGYIRLFYGDIRLFCEGIGLFDRDSGPF